jgi:hypothetical protein
VRPEEDLPPSWLRDYGDIDADIRHMEDLAAKLDAEVKGHYIPHLDLVDEAMVTQLPQPPEDFPELVSFMTTHNDAQQLTTINAHVFRDATGGFAYAAGEVSKHYRGSDVFAAAQVDVVQAALDQTAAARVPALGTDPSLPEAAVPPAPSSTPAPTDNSGRT